MTSVPQPSTRGPSTLRTALTIAVTRTTSEDRPLGPEQVTEPADREPELVGALGGHARGVPAPGGPGARVR